jgi:hypothetical protein
MIFSALTTDLYGMYFFHSEVHSSSAQLSRKKIPQLLTMLIRIWTARQLIIQKMNYKKIHGLKDWLMLKQPKIFSCLCTFKKGNFFVLFVSLLPVQRKIYRSSHSLCLLGTEYSSLAVYALSFFRSFLLFLFMQSRNPVFIFLFFSLSAPWCVKNAFWKVRRTRFCDTVPWKNKICTLS